MKKLLTKSNYLIGLKCLRSLWIIKNKPDLVPEFDLDTKHRMENGNKIGQLAKQYFENGIDIPEDDFDKSLKLSKEYLEKRKILFEAGFLFERFYSRADILKPVGENEWDIIEVKSGGKIKEENICDVSYQKFVYENCGLKIRNCYLMHVNTDYIFKGKLDLDEFFIIENINDDIYEIEKNEVNDMLKIIDSNEYIGSHCENPKTCPIPNLDWNFLPKNSVFTLYNIRIKKAMEYFNNNYIESKDVLNNFKLNEKQKIQINCEISNETHINKSKIKSFLSKFRYPLYYIDFETYNPPIPIYDGMKPYQRIPFQFSLHIQNSHDDKLIHYEFLAEGRSDPREDFINYINKYIKNDDGSIVVYNQGFEKGVLKELSDYDSKFKEIVKSYNDRFVDLLDLFRDFSYYNPIQNGSCSIKAVLPAIYPEKNHKHLDICDGMRACIEYEKSIWEYTNEKQIEKIRKDLLEYCALDTMGMIHIKEELEKLSK
ncbi:MAG: DUF2779 domain-containing protein [Nanoarchaeota archaeon]|nr:DUF2779 domain-containing protein [Nanoarchaeota archaeon]